MFKAVTKEGLIEALGHECSPDRNRKGYVIGPTESGRVAQCASLIYYEDAVKLAEELNKLNSASDA